MRCSTLALLAVTLAAAAIGAAASADATASVAATTPVHVQSQPDAVVELTQTPVLGSSPFPCSYEAPDGQSKRRECRGEAATAQLADAQACTHDSEACIRAILCEHGCHGNPLQSSAQHARFRLRGLLIRCADTHMCSGHCVVCAGKYFDFSRLRSDAGTSVTGKASDVSGKGGSGHARCAACAPCA